MAQEISAIAVFAVAGALIGQAIAGVTRAVVGLAIGLIGGWFFSR